MSARVYVFDDERRRRARVSVRLGASKQGEIQAGTVLTYTATGATAGAVAGPYGAAAGAILGAAWGITQGLMGPSKSWRGFAKRIAAGIAKQQADVQRLIEKVNAATSELELNRAVREFNAPLDRLYKRPAGGPFDLHTPPGATGTAHEGGIRADFAPIMDKIRQAIALKRQALSPAGQAAAAAAAAEAARPRPVLAGTLFGMPLWLWFGMSGVAFVASMFTGRRR